MPIKFAAKKIGWSQNDKGYVLRLLVAPDDDWEQVSLAPLGTPFGVVMVSIDAESGLNNEASPGSASKESVAGPLAGQQRGEAGKPRRPFHEMSRAQQAGILCQDPTFGLWLSTEHYGRDAVSLTATNTAELVRHICGVHSRAELSEDRVAGKKWDQLVTNFYAATGRLAEQRG